MSCCTTLRTYVTFYSSTNVRQTAFPRSASPCRQPLVHHIPTVIDLMGHAYRCHATWKAATRITYPSLGDEEAALGIFTSQFPKICRENNAVFTISNLVQQATSGTKHNSIIIMIILKEMLLFARVIKIWYCIVVTVTILAVNGVSGTITPQIIPPLDNEDRIALPVAPKVQGFTLHSMVQKRG